MCPRKSWLDPLNQAGWQAQARAPSPLSARHAAAIGLMVHAQQVQQAMQHQNAAFLLDGVAECARLDASARQRYDNIAEECLRRRAYGGAASPAFSSPNVRSRAQPFTSMIPFGKNEANLWRRNLRAIRKNEPNFRGIPDAHRTTAPNGSDLRKRHEAKSGVGSVASRAIQRRKRQYVCEPVLSSELPVQAAEFVVGRDPAMKRIPRGNHSLQLPREPLNRLTAEIRGRSVE
jgi:hypothetical protein